MLVLVGEAGVGKTRLARETLARLSAEGSPTTWTVATHSAATVPLGALAPLLPRDDMTTDRPLDAFGALAARFATDSGPRTVLAADDVHLLDDASARSRRIRYLVDSEHR